MINHTTDYTVENHGSVLLVRSQNTAAEQHLQAHVSDDSQWFGHALVVEPRYARALVEQLGDDGFSVS